MSHQLDRALDEMDIAMNQLRRAIRGIPVRREGFKRTHDQFARSTAVLIVALTDCRSAIKG